MPVSRQPKLDPESLRTFVTVAQLRSFSAAAELLHKTTSAVSYRIKTLEDSIGTPLFERTTRSVALTSSGEVLLDKASQIFEWLETLPEELKQVSSGIEPQFTLVVNNLLYDSQALADLLADLHTRFAHTAFKVRQAVYMGVWDELMHRGGHLALGVPGFHTINDEFLTEPLGVVNWVFVVAKGHPLAALEEPLSNEQLRRYPAVNVEDTSQQLHKRTAWRLPGQQEMIVPDLRAKIECHVKGLGVGFLPARVVRTPAYQSMLVELRVSAGRSPSPLALAWRRQGAGKVSAYVRSLFGSGSRLAAQFCGALDSAATPLPDTTGQAEGPPS
jgi:LysR family transcriptional regulator, transcriptional activator of the allD operon